MIEGWRWRGDAALSDVLMVLDQQVRQMCFFLSSPMCCVGSSLQGEEGERERERKFRLPWRRG